MLICRHRTAGRGILLAISRSFRWHESRPPVEQRRRSSEGNMHRFGKLFKVLVVLLTTTTLFRALSTKPLGAIRTSKASGATRARRHLNGRTRLAGKKTPPRGGGGRVREDVARAIAENLCSGSADQRRTEQGIWLETAQGRVPPGTEHLAGRGPAGRKDPLHAGRPEAVGRAAEDRGAYAGECSRRSDTCRAVHHD